MSLKTEQNTPEIEDEVHEAASVSDRTSGHADLQADFEHGQWWITCVDCGAQWSVVDAEGGPSVGGFDFELVTGGDEGWDR
jgi:hypothetical protein